MFKKIKEFFTGKPAEVVAEVPYKVEAEVAPAVVEVAPAVVETPAKAKKPRAPAKPKAPKAPAAKKPRAPKAPK
jgi:hypothetical protein